VTPIGSRIARPLAEGLRNRVVCRSDEAARLMPQRLLGVREAIRAALQRVDNNDVETIWSAAGPVTGDPEWSGGTTFRDELSVEVDATPQAVFRAVCRVGGGHGWYAADWLWRLRGWMDRLVGGPGLRRGRRDPERVTWGEALDFWRVIGVEQDRDLLLLAEMKLPGDATLEFRVEPLQDEPPRTRLRQIASFQPKGLFGLAYWYAVKPLHGPVFRGMMRGIRQAAEHNSTETPGRGSSPQPYAS
jgi:hypothetical protein